MSRRHGRFAWGAALWCVMAGAVWAYVPATPASGDSFAPFMPPAPPLEIVIGSERFEPGTVRVPAGATIAWRNLADVPHEVTGEGFASGPIAPGESFRHTFVRPGRHPYACDAHRSVGMVGAVLVER